MSEQKTVQQLYPDEFYTNLDAARDKLAQAFGLIRQYATGGGNHLLIDPENRAVMNRLTIYMEDSIDLINEAMESQDEWEAVE